MFYRGWVGGWDNPSDPQYLLQPGGRQEYYKWCRCQGDLIVLEEWIQLQKHTESVFLNWSGALTPLRPELRMRSTHKGCQHIWLRSWAYRSSERKPFALYIENMMTCHEDLGDGVDHCSSQKGAGWVPHEALAIPGVPHVWSLCHDSVDSSLSVPRSWLWSSPGAVLGKIISSTENKGFSGGWDGATLPRKAAVTEIPSSCMEKNS